MPNPFAHVELNTDDVQKAKKFYQAVFAWKLKDIPDMSYTMIDVAGGVGGGIATKKGEAPSAWLPYVQVDNLKATMAKAIKLGATPALEYQDIGDMGAIGIFIDPSGAMLGLWQSKTPAAAPPPPPAKQAVAKKAPAKKAPAKKVVAKKAAAKAAPAPAKKAPAKKAAAKAAPAKKAAAKAAAAPAKKAPAKKG